MGGVAQATYASFLGGAWEVAGFVAQAAEGVEERGFAGVGITDEGDARGDLRSGGRVLRFVRGRGHDVGNGRDELARQFDHDVLGEFAREADAAGTTAGEGGVILAAGAVVGGSAENFNDARLAGAADANVGGGAKAQSADVGGVIGGHGSHGGADDGGLAFAQGGQGDAFLLAVARGAVAVGVVGGGGVVGVVGQGGPPRGMRRRGGDCRQAYPLKGCGNWAWWYLRLSRNNDSGVEAASNNCFGILKNSDRGE